MDFFLEEVQKKKERKEKRRVRLFEGRKEGRNEGSRVWKGPGGRRRKREGMTIMMVPVMVHEFLFRLLLFLLLLLPVNKYCCGVFHQSSEGSDGYLVQASFDDDCCGCWDGCCCCVMIVDVVVSL